jgi:hypothetical protein
MRTSSLAAVSGAALVLFLPAWGHRAAQSPPGAVRAAFFQEPAMEQTEKDQVYRWETIALRHADAVSIAASLGGVIGPTAASPLDLDDLLDPTIPLANIVPEGIQGIIALPGVNKLLVRGTTEDVGDLRKLVEHFDYPQPRYRLTVWSETQTMSMVVLEREWAHFTDRSPTRRLEVDLSARMMEHGTVVVRLSGTAGAGQRECSFSSTMSLKPGVKARALEFDSPNGRSSIHVRADVDRPPL